MVQESAIYQVSREGERLRMEVKEFDLAESKTTTRETQGLCRGY